MIPGSWFGKVAASTLVQPENRKLADNDSRAPARPFLSAHHKNQLYM